MKKNFCVSAYFILQYLIPVLINAQGLNTHLTSDTLLVNINNEYKISSLNIIPFSEKVYLNKRLLNKSEYNFRYSTGTFSLALATNYSLVDTLCVIYETVKINLQKEYKRRTLLVSYDNLFKDTVRTLKSVSSPITTESIFGKGIQKSGTLVRGFTFGTNKDLQLNSGLRLQLSGKLSDEIDIVAALTDENTPIQAEGNTETLEELDKVFIEIRHKNAVGTFGDYVLDITGNEFSNISRKLQGLKGEVMFGETKGTVAVASSKGKFNNNNITGEDGNQGPYRLYGVNNENAIILISGTERVYVDGELMKRGENNDYVIDYSNAEVTFTPKRLITSASRISVDFEYTDQNFKRDFFGADFSTKVFNDKLKIGIGYFREGDDENNPIEYSFTDEDMDILRKAGNDRSKAVKSGVSLATADTTGAIQGIYTKIDTIINNESFSYYKYLPGSSSSIYNVSFSYVGSGYGDYNKESLGKYIFVGIKQGSYLPVIYLPMPELKQLGNVALGVTIMDGITVSGEFSGSSNDKNKLSSLDDNNNFGYARKLQFDMIPREIKLGGRSIGKIGLSMKDRFVQGKYSALDRIDDVDFNRYYNLSNEISADQTLREFNMDYLPLEEVTLNTKYGYLKEGDSFNSNRIFSSLNVANKKQYKLFYQVDYVSSKNSSVESDWIKENGEAFYTLGSFKPGFTFLYENKEENTLSGGDSLLSTSLKYVEAAPYLEFKSETGIDFRVGYSMRDESFPLDGVMTKQSSTSMEQFQLNYRSLKEFTTSLNLTFRNKKYTDKFIQQGYADNQTILMLSQSRFNLGNGFISGDLYYQAATEQSAKLQKVFVKVTKGTGNYIYLGDLDNNGIADENEFQLAAYDADYVLVTVKTDKLYPVIDLKANTRWRIDFSKGIKGDNFFAKVFKPVSTETSWRIEENSNETDTKKIYLLNLASFLNDSTTITGSQVFQHDFNFFQNKTDFSARLRYIQRKTLSQYSGGIERGYFSERGLRITFKLVPEISNQTDLTNQNDNMISPAITNRAREVTKNSIATDFSYRPQQNVEVGFKFESARSLDDYPEKSVTVDMNSQTLRLNLSFQNLGRLRLEFERTELTASSSSYSIPYEITRGNVIGKNYFWRAFFDYRVNSFIQTSFSYDARSQGGGRVIQTMRAEAKAYF